MLLISSSPYPFLAASGTIRLLLLACLLSYAEQLLPEVLVLSRFLPGALTLELAYLVVASQASELHLDATDLVDLLSRDAKYSSVRQDVHQIHQIFQQCLSSQFRELLLVFLEAHSLEVPA